MKLVPEVSPRRLVPVAMLACASLGLTSAAAAEGPAAPDRASVTAQERSPSGAEVLLLGRVVSHLAESASLSDADLRVEVDGREIVLRGTVTSEVDRTRAVRRARSVSGVVRVEDRLEVREVRGAPSEPVNDGALARELAQRIVDDLFRDAEARQRWAFGWEVDGAAWEFDVEVDGGDVTLSGTLPWAESVPDVIDLVRSVPGVRTVRNDLRMDLDYRPPDKDGWVFRRPR